MNKKKKWIIGCSVIGALALVASSLTVLLWPIDAPTAMTTYSLSFKGEGASSKNKLIQDSVKAAKDIMDNYYRENPNIGALEFYYANLKSTQTQGERNFYTALDRSMKTIHPKLGINNVQRTPKTVNDAFYNKNTEMMSFYWSPDYNNIGTWIKYMLTETYTVPNVWYSTYPLLEKGELDWAISLKEFIQKYNIPGTQDPLYMSPIEMTSYVASNKNTKKQSLSELYTSLANVIGNWIATNSPLNITSTTYTNPATGKEEQANVYGELPVGIKFVNYVSSMNPNIPFQEVGAGTASPVLVTNGLYLPTNSNSDINFRDWYRYADVFSSSVAKDWYSADPFQANETPWNGPFSKASNTLFAQSVWTNLTSWSTRGDENDPNFNSEPIRLLSSGIVEDITNESTYEKIKNEFENDKTLTFTINPIEWVNTKGEGTGSFLSPEDFWAGFYSFGLSVKNKMNANNAYFIGLASVDFEATLALKENRERNLSTSDRKQFKIIFKDPILSLDDTLDILQKQYFCALPAQHKKVQNIIDPVKYNSIAVNYPGTETIDTAATDMKQFYGVGDGRNPEVWGDLWSTGPYYISNVDRQSITYKLNTKYFDAFEELANSNDYYKSYRKSYTTNSGKVATKIPEINIKYAGSYNLDILFEQFKSKEINKTPVQGSNLLIAINNYSNNLRYESVKKISKSNLVSFNLQVYEKWSEPLSQTPSGYAPAENIIIDTDGNPMWDPISRTPTYTIDEYGNYVFPEGKQPKLKSNVSKQYYDLIVKDFYTPNGTSATIRFAIMNSINWVSLQTLVTPGVTGSIQYSFMPYGVYTFANTGDEDLTGEYWDLVANKRYMTKEELTTINDENLEKRKSGNMIWTYEEMLMAMIK